MAIDLLGDGNHNIHSMDSARKKRYYDKLKFVKDSLQFFSNFGEDELDNRGILYSIQVAIESTVDMVAMLLKDLGLIIMDDRTNIEKLVQEKKWEKSMAELLIKANGLRNIIGHQYNGIQKDIVNSSIFPLKHGIQGWITHIEEVLSTFDSK